MIALVKEHMVLGGLPVKPDTQEMLTTPETIASAPDKRKMSVTVVYITIAVIAIAALAAGLIYFGIHKAAQKSKKNAR
jgi:predicted secreted protein